MLCTIVLVQPMNVLSQGFVSCEINQGIPFTTHRLSLAVPNPSPGPSSLTWPEAQERFEAAARAYSKRKLPSSFKLKFSSTSAINAFVEGTDTITITSGLLRNLSHANQLTFVFCHEMAHIALNHPRKSTSQMEQAADELAIFVLRDLNIDPCSSLLTLASMKRYAPLHSQSLQQRWAYLSRGSAAHCLLSGSSDTPIVSLH